MYDLFLIIQISESYFLEVNKTSSLFNAITLHLPFRKYILNTNITSYIYIIFFLCFTFCVNGQIKTELSLLITSSDSTQNKTLKTINYRKTFYNKNNLISSKDSVFNILKQIGYYSLTSDSLSIKNNNYKFYIDLGKKIKSIKIYVQKKDLALVFNSGVKLDKNLINIPANKLKSMLEMISNQLIENGESFSKVNIINITNNNSRLEAMLNIKHSLKRTIDKIIVKGYNDFPKSFLKNHFNLKHKSIFNNAFIKKVSKKTNQLDFARTIKEPEVLFSKDSTLLYLYLDKKKSNSFDGLINFNSENKKIKFQGHLDLKLNNTLNKGEKIHLFWRNNGTQKQELSVFTKVPYLFNTKLSASAKFNLFKNDSLFSNTKFDAKLFFPLYNKFDLSFIITKEVSNTNQSNLEVQNFNTTGIGFGFENTTLKYNPFTFNISLLLNNQKTADINKYFMVSLRTKSIFTISRSFDFSLKLNSKITNRKTQMANELIRSGGINSIRGFRENSILSNSFAFINSDFIFSKNKKNHIFSIQDVGVFNLNSFNIIKSSIGLGYRQITSKNSLSVSYVIGDPLKNNITNSSIVTVKLLTFF